MKPNFEKNQKIIDLYISGLSSPKIGKIMNLTTGDITHILRTYAPYLKKHDRSGNKNSHWKGGITYDRGRKLIYTPNHPKPNKFGTHCYEYVLIIEKKLGRYLEKNEIVHHIDGDVTNNNINNLQVMPQKEHIKLHKKNGDMEYIPKSKYRFKYKNEKEYKKKYNQIYLKKNKLRLIEYRKNQWRNLTKEERNRRNKIARENYLRRKKNAL